ncbi:DMT family transporter [Dactylosporangium sp. NPDC051484]|uniref:DMT family transporter n=1 Tax=Dactylosporangium sp. NPDC051484 TaxID=3154942 RepID=UPI003450D0ED
MGILALLWGSGFLWIKIALTGLAPVQITFVRCVLGSAVLLVLARTAGQRLPRGAATWGRLIVAALFCNALPFALFAIGEQTAASGLAGVLNATTALWSLVVGIAIGTDRTFEPVRLGGLALGFAGVVLIFAPWHEHRLPGWGAFALLGAAASYAVAFAYMGRKLVGRGTEPLALSAAQLLAATGLSALALPFGGFTAARVDAVAIGAVVVLGIVCTGITFFLHYRLIADVGATSASTVGYLLPVVSVALGAVVLGEALGLRHCRCGRFPVRVRTAGVPPRRAAVRHRGRRSRRPGTGPVDGSGDGGDLGQP